MFSKLFGKKDGFYMQVDESAPAKEEKPKAAAAPAKTVDVAAQAAAASIAEPVSVIVESEESAVAPAKAKSAKTSIKKDKKKDEEKAKEVVAEPVVVAKAAPTITNFATDYLVIPAVAGNRRRPGANMKGFMTMAREVKESKKGSVGNQQKVEGVKKATKPA
jgi:hypothetical protein